MLQLRRGVFHESANFALLHGLPILFVCENNRYSCFTNIKERQPSDDMTRLAECHGIENLRMNGNDVIKVYKQSEKIIKKLKNHQNHFFFNSILLDM